MSPCFFLFGSTLLMNAALGQPPTAPLDEAKSPQQQGNLDPSAQAPSIEPTQPPIAAQPSASGPAAQGLDHAEFPVIHEETSPVADPAGGQTPLADRREDEAEDEESAPDSDDEEAKATPLATSLALGASLGGTTGIGVAARKHFENGLGFHVAVGGVAGNDRGWMNLGSEILYTFKRYRRVRFYAFVGAAVFANKGDDFEAAGASETFETESSEGLDPTLFPDTQEDLSDPYVPSRDDDEWSLTLLAGPGVGTEFHFGDHVGWSIELPLTVWTSLKGDRPMPLGGEINLLPTPNTSLMFYF
jgi:hypothetical protein